MGLDLPGLKNIFPHSQRVETGLGKERVGQATVVVALDGTGDFDSIQEAIDFLPTKGGVVYIKEGTHTISTKISISGDNVGLIGAGRSTILNVTSSNGISIGNVTNIIIEGLTMRGSGSGALIVASTGTPNQITIKDNYFHTWDGHGLDLRTGQYLVEGNFFEDVGNSDNAKNAITLGATKSIITNNIFNACPSDGLVSSATDTMNIISNNILIDCGRNGIQIGGDNAIVSNNISISNGHSGIFVSGGDNVNVSGNICNDNVRNGINMSSSNNCIINGNVCNGNDSANTTSFSGIFIGANCDNNIIASNRCSGNDNYGINISASTNDKTLAHGNHLLGNTTGALNDAGTNTTSADNVTT